MATKTEAAKCKEEVRGKLTKHEEALIAELYAVRKGNYRAIAGRLMKR